MIPLLLVAPALATAVPGTLSTDTTWSAAGSPYVLSATTTVLEGATLSVEPGVTVRLCGECDLVVQGSLVARGTADLPVRFEGEGWGSVIFEEGSLDAVFDGVDSYASGSVLHSAVVTGGGQAVQIRGASPYLYDVTFESNTYEPDEGQIEGGAALLVTDGSTARIQACTFVGNAVGGYGYGGAVYVDQASPLFQDCVFLGNASAYGGALATAFFYGAIVGCSFEGNETLSEGGAASFVSSSPVILDTVVSGNQSLLDGGGIHVCVDCNPHAMPVVEDCTFTENVALVGGAGGFGAAYLAGFTANNLEGNLLLDEPADFGWWNLVDPSEADWVEYPVIPSNWWGTADGDAIARTIWDGADDALYGTVDPSQPLSSPVTQASTRVALVTQRFAYGYDGQTMPVWLTLYNPGAEREVELALLLQVDEGPVAFWHGDLAFPGAVRGLETFTLTLPERSVWQELLLEPSWIPSSVTSATWHAVLVDPATGQRIDSAPPARADLVEGGV